jgi:hypothetical protein
MEEGMNKNTSKQLLSRRATLRLLGAAGAAEPGHRVTADKEASNYSPFISPLVFNISVSAVTLWLSLRADAF